MEALKNTRDELARVKKNKQEDDKYVQRLKELTVKRQNMTFPTPRKRSRPESSNNTPRIKVVD